MNISIPITIHSDEKGYFDRECPNEKCLYTFKVLMTDWEEKVSDNEVHCPLCGYVSNKDRWWTQEQIAKINTITKNFAMNYIQGKLDKCFKRLEASTRGNKYFRIKYKTNHRISFVNNPIGQREEWETEICCEKCGTHYSVIGSAYFCPCCGHNSAVNSFNDSLDSIRKMLESLSEMKLMLKEKYDVDSAESMCRSLLESSIGDMVSAFQKFASCRYEELSGKQSRVNDFQIVEKGSKLFEEEIGKKYSDWISDSELDFMSVMFQKRHLLEHNNGMVDQKYLDKSHDTSYSIGQRIIVKTADAFELLDVLRRLGTALIKIQRSGNFDGSSSNQ